MNRADPRLVDAIRSKLGISDRQVRRLIEQKVKHTFLDRHHAALMVAADAGLNPGRFGSSEDLSAIREARLHSPHRAHQLTEQNGTPDPVQQRRRPLPTVKKGTARRTTSLRRNSRSNGRDPKRVFVVYGRNGAAYNAIVLFLQALRLNPRDFLEIRNELKGAPFIGNIVRAGIERAQATVVLFTPDEFSALRPSLQKSNDPERDRRRWQARPNVIFEAGMALAFDEERTILVTLGDVALPSDLDGRHIVRLNNSVDARKALKEALEGVGCAVEETGRWHDHGIAGDFDACVQPPRLPTVAVADPFSAPKRRTKK